MTNLILLVSDDDRGDSPLKLALTRMAPQFGVELATSRVEIEALRTPALILFDLKLSREPAFELLRWLRTHERYRQIPLFVLTPRTDDVTNAYALGADSCLLRQPSQRLGPIAQGIAAYASLIAEPPPGGHTALASATV